jgi:hypothetical protein
MATRGRLCNDFSPLQTFDKLNLFIRHLKTKLVLFLLFSLAIYKNKVRSSLILCIDKNIECKIMTLNFPSVSQTIQQKREENWLSNFPLC